MPTRRTNTAEKAMTNLQSKLGEIPIPIDTPGPEMAANVDKSKTEVDMDPFFRRTGAFIPKQEVQDTVTEVKQLLTVEQNRKNYMSKIENGRAGLCNNYFEKFPTWKIDQEAVIIPMRQKLIADLGKPPSMEQIMLIDLLLITYHTIMRMELAYGGMDLMLDTLKLKKGEGVYGCIQDEIDRLYRRLDLIFGMLDKTIGRDRAIKVKAIKMEIGQNNLSGGNLS